jgi:aspartate/methionine/tyrosine aminotransferase
MEFVKQRPISPVRAIGELVPTVSKDRPVFNGTVGEPTHAVLEQATNAMAANIEAFRGKPMGYTSFFGDPECRNRVAAVINKEYTAHDGNVPGFTGENVLMSAGASSGLQAAIIGLADENVPVLTPAPYYLLYKSQADLAHAALIPMDVSQTGYKITPAMLDAYLSAVGQRQGVSVAETRANVLLDYPGNPIGTMLNAEEWKGIADVLRKYPKVNIMLDEIYRDVIVAQDEQGNPKQYVSLLHVAPDLKDRTLMFFSGSKGPALAGERIGSVVGPKEAVAELATIQFPFLVHPSRTAQAGFATAMEQISASPAEKKRISDFYRERIDIVKKGLGAATINANIEGAFYVVADLKDMIGSKFSDKARAYIKANPRNFEGLDTPIIQNDKQIALHLLFEHGAAVTPGSGFGFPPEAGKMRVACTATPEQLHALTDAMNTALTQARNARNEVQKPWLSRVLGSAVEQISSAIGLS